MSPFVTPGGSLTPPDSCSIGLIFAYTALDVFIKSEGCEDPDKTINTCGRCYIQVEGQELSPHGRGHNVVVLDGETGNEDEFSFCSVCCYRYLDSNSTRNSGTAIIISLSSRHLINLNSLFTTCYITPGILTGKSHRSIETLLYKVSVLKSSMENSMVWSGKR